MKEEGAAAHLADIRNTMSDSNTIQSSPIPGFGLLLALLCLMAAGKVILGDTLDPDCFWHLRVGGELAGGFWPHPLIDDLSFASIRQPWTPYSWLAEIGMKRLWDVGGFRAAIAVQALMESAFIFFLGASALELSQRVTGQPRYMASAVAAAMGGVLSLAYLSFRPVTAALTILAFIAFLLLRDRRLDRRSRLVWLVPPLTAILINIHFFAIFAPLWTGALLAGDILERSSGIRRGIILFALTSLGCCMTPLLGGTIRAVLDYSAHDPMVQAGAVAEFRPFYLGVMGNISAVFLMILIACVIYRMVRPPRFPLGETIWLAGSTLLLFRMGRMAPIFAIIAVPAFAAVVPSLSDRILTRRPIIVALGVVVALCAVPILRAFPRGDQSLSAWLNRNGPDAPNYPCKAADFVDTNISGQTRHLLCDFTWGGFLEWRLGPRYQTLMDGRTQLFSPQFWRSAALGSADQRRNFLAAIPADAAIVRAQKSPLSDALTALKWKVVYRDQFAEVLVPPQPIPQAVSKTE